MFYLSREELLEHLRASGHPKGVFSTASRGLEVPSSYFHESHLSLEVPVEQETLTLSFMEEEEEDRTPGAFQVRMLVAKTIFHMFSKFLSRE